MNILKQKPNMVKTMEDYKKKAIIELENGNYDQYLYFMKMNRVARRKKKEIPKEPIRKNVTQKRNVLEKSYKNDSVSPHTLKKKSSKRSREDRWNYQQRTFLKENYKFMSDEELGNHLGRTAEAVKCERKKLKLLRQPANRRWTEEEDQFLLKNFKDMSFKEIGKKLNRKPKQISARLAKLGSSKVNRYDLVINGNTVASGTIKEISEQLNANLYTVKRWRTDGVSWAEFIKLEGR